MKVEIKDQIIKRLDQRVKEGKDFRNVEEYVNYILQQVVDRLNLESPKSRKEDEEKVKERLKSLGYME